MLTQERLKELLCYEPETGVFKWLKDRTSIKRGHVAGSVRDTGYICISVDGVRYLAHRLAFLFMTGSFPPDEVDHVNGIKSDNRWGNLRLASRSLNNLNRGMLGHNKSGHKGVSWNSTKQRWVARGQISGRPVHLGFFANIADASNAYREFALANYGDFAHQSLVNN